MSILCVAFCLPSFASASSQFVSLNVSPYTVKMTDHYNASVVDWSVYGFGTTVDYRWHMSDHLYVGASAGYMGFLEKEMLPERYCSEVPLLATFGFHHEGKNRVSWHAGLGAGVEFGFFGSYSGTYFECQIHGGVSYALTERFSLTGKSDVSLIVQPNRRDDHLNSILLVVTPLSLGVSYAF